MFVKTGFWLIRRFLAVYLICFTLFLFKYNQTVDDLTCLGKTYDTFFVEEETFPEDTKKDHPKSRLFIQGGKKLEFWTIQAINSNINKINTDSHH